MKIPIIFFLIIYVVFPMAPSYMLVDPAFFFGWSLCLLLGFTVIFFLELTFSLTDFFSFLTVSRLAPRLSDFVCTCLDAGKDGQTL